MRINQFIARAGISSRRGADALIKMNLVRVNKRTNTMLGLEIKPETDVVEVCKNNKWIKINVIDKKETYAFNKPRGIVTSMHREKKEKIVADYFPKQEGLFPVGRLDRESDGLLIMTNDGDLAQKILDKKNNIIKTYEVICQVPNIDKREQIENKLQRCLVGIRSKGEKLKAESVELITIRKGGIIKVHVTLIEGRNRHIRRMMGALHFDVLQLTRLSVGGLTVDNLKIQQGKIKLLCNEELKLLLHNPA